MKIRFEMSKKETTVLKNIAIKYAPVDVELKAFQDKLVENKTGRYEIKANDGAPIVDVNVNEDLIVEFMKFGEECFGTVVTAINILKPFIENFTDIGSTEDESLMNEIPLATFTSSSLLGIPL